MVYTSLLPQYYWPLQPYPTNVLEYYRQFKYYKRPQLRVEVIFETRAEFLAELDLNEEFRVFWDTVESNHPENEDYFEALFDEDEPFEPSWIEEEYRKFKAEVSLRSLSKEEQDSVESEFQRLKILILQRAREGEALRLGCDDLDLPAVIPVLPLSAEEGPSRLLLLPESLFCRIMRLLDNFDIFRMTLVCKQWKQLVIDNASTLRYAEHAVTKHLLTFSDWMDPAREVSVDSFDAQYTLFARRLIEWYCEISQNVEKLVLNHQLCPCETMGLLENCPNLKFLQLGDEIKDSDCYNYESLKEMKFTKLEVFISAGYEYDFSQDLVFSILSNGCKLRAFGGYVSMETWTEAAFEYPISLIFANLVALDLICVSVNVLQQFLNIDEFQLKYLRIGLYGFSGENHADIREQEKTAQQLLYQLLPRMKSLEFLILTGTPGTTKPIIKLITRLRLNLKFALFWEPYVDGRRYDNEEAMSHQVDRFDPESLLSLQKMLLYKDPNRDLSRITFFASTETHRKKLEDAKTEFSIKVDSVYGIDDLYLHGLDYPPLQRCLDLVF